MENQFDDIFVFKYLHLFDGRIKNEKLLLICIYPQAKGSLFQRIDAKIINFECHFFPILVIDTLKFKSGKKRIGRSLLIIIDQAS